VGHPLSLAFALDHAAWLYQYRGECIQTREGAETDVKYSSEQGFPFFLAQGTILRGWALAEQGQEAEGIAQMSQGLAAHRATGARLIQPYWTSLLAWAHGKAGHVDEGLRLLSEALEMMHGQHVWGAELQRLKGELLLLHGRDASGTAAIVTGEPAIQAEGCFRQALQIARSQIAKSLELRAATSLARLWGDQGKRAKPVISSRHSITGSPKVWTPRAQGSQGTAQVT
jgi:predicted ATPase